MPASDFRLSQIQTCWSIVLRARAGPGQKAPQARQALLERYGPAVRRYLQAALPKPEAADDLYQDFCVKLLNGDFSHAAPERGRFRFYVKTAVIHLIGGYYRRTRQQPAPLAAELLAAHESGESAAGDSFMTHWREQLLDNCWSALAEHERATGTPYHAALRLRAAEPRWRIAAIADRLSQESGQRYEPDSLRVVIYRARLFFADRLIDAIANSLADASPDEIEAELIQLRLLEYCRAALQRYRESLARRAMPSVSERLEAHVSSRGPDSAD